MKNIYLVLLVFSLSLIDIRKGLFIKIDRGENQTNISKEVRAHKVSGRHLNRQIYYKRIKNPTDRHKIKAKPSLRDGRILTEKLIYGSNLSNLTLSKKKHKRKRKNKTIVQEKALNTEKQLSLPQSPTTLENSPKMVFDNPELMAKYPNLVKQGSFIEGKLKKVQQARQGMSTPVQSEIKKLNEFKKDVKNADQINNYFKPVKKKVKPIRRLVGESSIVFKRRKKKLIDSVGGTIPVKKKQVVDRAAKNFITNYTRNIKSTKKELKDLKKDMKSMVKNQRQMQKMLNKIIKKRMVI